MGSKPFLLCVGRDLSLNRTRHLVLQRVFEVTLAGSAPEATEKLAQHRFDLVLLCYSLDLHEIGVLLDAARKAHPRPRILALAQIAERLHLERPDEEFLAAGPAELLEKAAAMVGLEVNVDGWISTPQGKLPGSGLR